MKKNDLEQIKTLSIPELTLKEVEFRSIILDLELDKNLKKTKDVSLVFKKKRDLAQVLTIKRQKELVLELSTETTKSEDEKDIEPLVKTKSKERSQNK